MANFSLNIILTKIRKFLLFFIQTVNFWIFPFLIKLGLSFRIKKRVCSEEYQLVLRTDAIGDYILSLDAIKTLVEQKNKKSVLVVNKNIAGFITNLGFDSKIIPFERERFIVNPFYHLKVLKELVKYSYSEAYYLNFSRELLGDEIIKTSEAKNCYAWNGDVVRIFPFMKKMGNRVYSYLLYSNKKNLHELKRNNEFVQKVLKIGEVEIKKCNFNNILKKINVKLNFKDFFIISPGSRIEKKIWQLDKFAKVIEYVYNKYNLVPVLIGPEKEKPLGLKIKKKTNNVPLIFAFGRYTFEEILVVLKKSKFLLSNDSAIVHFAVKLGVKSVTILGGGQFGRFAPYGTKNNKWVYYKMSCYNCDWVCKYSEFKCVQNIEVEKVKQSINELIRNNEKNE